MRSLFPVTLLAAALLATVCAEARELRVDSADSLRRALRSLEPGDAVLIAPGEYPGGHWIENVPGTKERPVVIRGLDPAEPPVFAGPGSEAIHLAGCSYVTLAHLAVRGFPANGINVDDAGRFDAPARGIRVEHVTILDTGPAGNHDALKLSGLEEFAVVDCRFEGWGGSAVDMVGCRGGVIERCRFLGKEGFSPSNAVQMKGGTRDVLVHLSWFRDCGHRAVNLGGSTGLEWFRPAPGDFEARDVTVAGNRFAGSDCAVAFVTARNGRFHHNTIYLPARWVLRILQETEDPRFEPCGGCAFEDNLVVYDGRIRTLVNVGPRTDRGSFVFRGNAWFAADASPPEPLPGETGRVCGVDPRLEDPGGAGMRIRSTDARLRGKGADGYRPPEAK